MGIVNHPSGGVTDLAPIGYMPDIHGRYIFPIECIPPDHTSTTGRNYCKLCQPPPPPGVHVQLPLGGGSSCRIVDYYYADTAKSYGWYQPLNGPGSQVNDATAANILDDPNFSSVGGTLVSSQADIQQSSSVVPITVGGVQVGSADGGTRVEFLKPIGYASNFNGVPIGYSTIYTIQGEEDQVCSVWGAMYGMPDHQIVNLDPTQTALYAANNWQTDPIGGPSGPKLPIIH